MGSVPGARVEQLAVFLALAGVLASCRYFDSLDEFTAGAQGQAGSGGAASDSSLPDGSGGTGGKSTACLSGDCTGSCEDCDGITSNGCEADTSADGEHCGACNDSCFGGPCSGGACDVFYLVTELTGPWSIVADSDDAYWVSEGDGTINGVPATGGAARELMSDQEHPTLIVADETRLFWANFSSGGSIHRVSKAGSDYKHLAQANGPRGLAVDSDYVYFSRTTDGRIDRSSKDGSAVTNFMSGLGRPRAIAVDDQGIYWVDMDDGTVWQAALDGSGITEIDSAQPRPFAIAVDATYVYWTNLGPGDGEGCVDVSGSIMRAPKIGGEPGTALATTQACPIGIAADGVSVFWTNEGTMDGGAYHNNGAVAKVQRSGGEPTLVASGQVRPHGIALNENSVFWTNLGTLPGTGSIATVPK